MSIRNRMNDELTEFLFPYGRIYVKKKANHLQRKKQYQQ